MEALNLGGVDFNALARHAASAYLNATDADVDYSISKNDIVVGVIYAFKTGHASFKDELEEANEKGCPLSRSELTTNSSSQTSKSELQNSLTANGLTAYPNPFTDRATIKFTLTKTEDYNVSLYDMQGRLVKQLKAGTAKAGEVNQVSVENRSYAEGMYFIKLKTKSNTQTMRLSLKR